MLSFLLLLSCNDKDETQAEDTAAVDVCALPPLVAPECGTATARGSVIAGPADAGWDSALGARADAVDRQAVGVAAWAMGTTTELVLYDSELRSQVESYITDGDGLTFDGDLSAVDYWSKVAGAYGGVNIASDAFRYGALRDEGADCDVVEEARAHLLIGLETLHLAQAITGEEGVISRGFARSDLPGAGEVETVDLFDSAGNALPEEKDNGTWRADNSGLYDNYKWEDSCSRDQYIGWVAGIAGAWEVIHDDPSIDDAIRDRLQADAAALARSLMVERESGYDMEIMDADGRMTYHGILHHESIDRLYWEDGENALNAVMGLGIVAALGIVAEAEDVDAYIADQLIAERELPRIIQEWLRVQVLIGSSTNFSNVNMAFIGGWLADRYVCDAEARSVLGEGLAELYGSEGSGEREPFGQYQSLYDLVYAMSRGEASARVSGGAAPDEAALERMVEGLTRFRPAPFWDDGVTNCDEEEIAAGVCELNDGTVVDIIGEGHNDVVISDTPIPPEIRPPSNYYWRSDPYRVNADGSGDALYPNVDWRFVYWAGRWALR